MNPSRLMLEANQGNAGRPALAVGEFAALLPQLVLQAIAGWQGEPQPLRT